MQCATRINWDYIGEFCIHVTKQPQNMHVLARNPAFVSVLSLGKICRLYDYVQSVCPCVHICGGGAFCSYRPTLICSHSLVFNRQKDKTKDLQHRSQPLSAFYQSMPKISLYEPQHLMVAVKENIQPSIFYRCRGHGGGARAYPNYFSREAWYTLDRL